MVITGTQGNSVTADVTRLLHQARQCWLAEQYDDALTGFRAAVRAAPDDLRLAVEAANYLGLRYETEEAEAILSSCLRRATTPDALFEIGLAYDRGFRPNLAQACYRQVIALDPNHVGAWIQIASWHERRHQLDQARQAIERIRSQDASVPEVRFLRAKLTRRAGDAEKAHRDLSELAADPQLSDQIRVDALYELAEIYDKQKNVGAAWAAATRAKALQQPKAKPHLQQARRLARLEANFVETVTREDFEVWQKDQRHDTVGLLTGPPRSGTSLIERMLGAHPQIVSADEFDAYPTFVQKHLLQGMSGTSASQVLNALPADRVLQSRTIYRRWIAAATNEVLQGRLLLDKNPSITFLVPVFRRLFPNAFVLMALRDPRDVVVSCYLRNFPLNPVSVMFLSIDTAIMRCRAEWIAWIKLRQKLTHPWTEVWYERLVQDPEAEARRLVSHFGLEWTAEVMQYRATLTERPVRSPTYEQLTAPVHDKAVGRWQTYAQFLAPHLQQLEPILQQLGYH